MSAIQIPSFDVPFGIKLWPLFDAAITKVSQGKFIPSHFAFVHGELPFSTFPPCVPYNQYILYCYFWRKLFVQKISN